MAISEDINDLLLSKGFERIGKYSKNGLVYTHPNHKYILKIFYNDPGYIAFYKAAAKNQDNPHFPKFRGRMIKLFPGKVIPDVYAIRMEKLEHSSIVSGKLISLIEFGISKGIFWRLRKIVFKDLWVKYPQLEESCLILNNAYEKNNVRLDLHSGNIMVRNNFPVIIDPFGSF